MVLIVITPAAHLQIDDCNRNGVNIVAPPLRFHIRFQLRLRLRLRLRFQFRLDFYSICCQVMLRLLEEQALVPFYIILINYIEHFIILRSCVTSNVNKGEEEGVETG